MKKFLYICDQSPFDNSYGAQQRTSLLCDVLCLFGKVDLVCFTSEAEPQSNSKANCEISFFGNLPPHLLAAKNIRIRKLLNIFLSFSPYSVYSKNREAYNITHNLLRSNQYDFIVIRYIKNAFLCGLIGGKRIIVDVDDLPEQSILSYVDASNLSLIKNLQYRFYAKRAKFHSNNFLKKINHSFFPNESQCVWKNSSYLPNIPFPKSIGAMGLSNSQFNDNEFEVLFVGFMLHSPNIQGVEYFVKNIWQRVKKAIPTATFRIAGKGVTPEQKIAWEKYEGVHVLGFVSDIDSLYRKCKVVVVPIYYGAGTNIKVLEAMAMRRACVISDYAARPYKNDLIDNINILIARDIQDFADKVIRLLLDKTLNFNIANSGARTIEEKYTYARFVESITKYVL
jgi:glycosyltransferase involved in cell wall biosynthesis